ncbi:MAG: hypothetical protein GX851_07175 [Clostridiales bacterium]|nr:hypothetical protein [Clostridiales bacterium]
MDAFNPSNELKSRISALFYGGKAPHALLIEGGTEKLRMDTARYVAQMMHCASPSPFPCGECAACKKSDADSHPDTIIVAKPEDKAAFRKETVKELTSDAYILPNESSVKVYIFSEFKYMRPDAQNVLLKTLEEPPPCARFILTAESLNSLIPTVQSRVTPLNTGYSQTAIEDGDSWEIAENIAKCVASSNEYTLLKATAVLEKEKQLLPEVLEYLTIIFRDAAVYRAGGKSLSSDGVTAKLLALSVPQANLIGLVRGVQEIDAAIQRNANATLLLTRLCSTLYEAAHR